MAALKYGMYFFFNIFLSCADEKIDYQVPKDVMPQLTVFFFSLKGPAC